MPKMKTHRSANKRYKVTASGKILRRQAGKGHLLAHKSPARKNRLTGMVEVPSCNLDLITTWSIQDKEGELWELNAVMF